MLTHTALSGNPAPGVYSQTLVIGNFFIVLSLVGEGVNLELGRNTLSKIEEIISQTPAISPKEVVEIEKEEFADGIKLSLLVARIENQKLHLASFGDVTAKLLRQRKIINLSSPAISGTLLHGDLLTLGTDQYFLDPSPENPRSAALEIKLELQQVDRQPATGNQPPVYLRQRHDFNFLHQRRLLIIVLLLFVTLVSTLAWQLRSKALENQQKIVQGLAAQVQEAENSAQKLSGLNNQIARELLLQTRQDFVSKADQNFGKKWPSPLSKTLADLDKQIAAVSGIRHLSTLDVFYDFSLLKAGAKITSVGTHKDQVMVLDSENGAVYSLNLKTKRTAIITGSDALKKGKFIDFAGEDYSVFSTDGIVLPKTVIKPSDKWGSIKDLKVYAGNTYLLDSVNNQIWKNGETPYLRAGSVDFSRVLQMAIDGSIYVLTSTGNIAKFTSGLPENFKITGLTDGSKDPRSFFTTDETENIYVLDQNGRRVVVLDKKGSYIAQYLIPDTSNNPNAPNPILVSESLKKAFLFSGAKVYSFDLK